MKPAKDIAPVHLLYGPEAFLKQQAVGEILRSLGEGDDADMGPVRFDGPSADLAEVLDSLRSYSLLGDRTVVIVDAADKFITQHRKPLETYCANPSETGILILICESSTSNTRLHKAIAAMRSARKFETPKWGELDRWIAQQSKNVYAKHMDGNAIAALRDLCDNSLGVLDSEISKLATFVGSRDHIKADDVYALVGHHRPEIVFEVTDAMAEGKPAVAMGKWEQILATDRSAPMKAIGGLAWGIRRLLQGKYAADQGANIGSIASSVRMDPRTLSRRLGAYSTQELEAQMCDLLEIDVNSKTGLGDVEAAVEKFIVTHARTAGGHERRR